MRFPAFAVGFVVSWGLLLPAAVSAECIDYGSTPGYFLGQVDTPGWIDGIFVAGNLAYLANYTTGFQILDVSDPAAPVLIGALQTPGHGWEAVVRDRFAFLADYDYGVEVIDVSDPTRPSIVASVDTPGRAMGIAISGDYAYVGDGVSRLQVIDISDPYSPWIAGHLDWNMGGAHHVAVGGGYAYVVDGFSLRIVDISNPTSPQLVATVDTPGGLYAEVALQGHYAYLAGGEQGLSSGFWVIDIADPTHPSIVGGFSTPGYMFGVAVAGDYAYCADDAAGMQVVDISDPLSPHIIGGVGTLERTYDLAVANDLVYIQDGLGVRIAPTQCPTPTPCLLVPVVTVREDGVLVGCVIPKGISLSEFRVYRKQADEDSTWECISPVLPMNGDEFEYLDSSVESGAKYNYMIEVIAPDGRSLRFGPVSAQAAVGSLALRVWPNPTNRVLTVTVNLPKDGDVALRTLDAQGRLIEVKSIVDATAGFHQWTWKPLDAGGHPLASGTYFLRLESSAGLRIARWTCAN